METRPRRGHPVAGAIEYSADLFDADTITRLAGHLTTLLSAAAAHPDQPISTLPLLTPDEHHTLQAWAQTSAPYPRNTCIHHLIEHHAATQPHATALVYADQHLTYHQLNTHANHLAHRLQTHGITRDTLVAVCLPRSLTLPIALLAILKAGGAYLPLDPTYPPQRLAFMLKDADAQLILTHESLGDGVPAGGVPMIHLDPTRREPQASSGENARRSRVQSSDALAYVIYTSGSTGTAEGRDGRAPRASCDCSSRRHVRRARSRQPHPLPRRSASTPWPSSSSGRAARGGTLVLRPRRTSLPEPGDRRAPPQ